MAMSSSTRSASSLLGTITETATYSGSSSGRMEGDFLPGVMRTHLSTGRAVSGLPGLSPPVHGARALRQDGADAGARGEVVVQLADEAGGAAAKGTDVEQEGDAAERADHRQREKHRQRRRCDDADAQRVASSADAQRAASERLPARRATTAGAVCEPRASPRPSTERPSARPLQAWKRI